MHYVRPFLFVVIAACLLPASAISQEALQVKPLTETIVTELPTGDLFWRVDNFRELAEAKAAMGPWSLVAESAGKVWLFTLGAAGAASSPGAMKVAQVGPVQRPRAKRYMLRINDVSGPPGSVTPIHSHPGSEAFFVLTGEQSIRHPHGVLRVKAGQTEPGHGADEAMQVSSSGATDLHALVMFVVDADRPFSTPATLPAPH